MASEQAIISYVEDSGNNEVIRVGPIGPNGATDCEPFQIRYQAGGMDFDFPYLDENRLELGLKYAKPLSITMEEYAEPKGKAVDEEPRAKVPQYLSKISKCKNLDEVRETFGIT